MNQTVKDFDIYQPFVVAAISLLKELADIPVSKKKVYTQYGKISTGGTAISISMTGDIVGQCVYEFSREFTMRISSKMIKEAQIITANPKEYQELLESTLKELSNMICGNVLNFIDKKYTNLNITPPHIFLGKNISLITKESKIIVIELSSSFGDFSINLNLAKQTE